MGPDETIQQTASPTADHPLASTIQFSSHQRAAKTRRGTNPTQEPDGRQEHHPKQGGGPGTQQRIHATAFRPFHASTPTPSDHPAGPAGTTPAQHAQRIS